MAKKTNISHKEKADTALKSASSVLERISGSTVSTQNPENDLKDEEELPDNV